MDTRLLRAQRETIKVLRDALKASQEQNRVLTLALDRVIANKFDRPVIVTEPLQQVRSASQIPMEHFADVMDLEDDAEFIAAVERGGVAHA